MPKTDTATEGAERARRTLERQDGFKHVSVSEVGAGKQVADFIIESPFLEHTTRTTASSFVIGADGRPDSFVMRFPTIYSDDVRSVDVWRALNETAERFDGKVATRGASRGGSERSHPHIESIRPIEPEDSDVFLPDDPADLAEILGEMRETFYEVLEAY